ncbi:hypothetical protein B0T24DRAFT_168445 [Lasiosphaeria ovina]|uniref:Uncharacterized protein n=1 Tax=Lasiosphaeria ovina TaxID=92902 RepID=A0AAE0NE28_9PEZI|nr:hypothetical protein B0T24DRAFT_168445 [Lasiosphaeria ovina]
MQVSGNRGIPILKAPLGLGLQQGLRISTLMHQSHHIEAERCENGLGNTHLTGDGDDSRSRRLSVFRGLPCGSEGLRGWRNDTDAVDDLLDVAAVGRSLATVEGCRESLLPLPLPLPSPDPGSRRDEAEAAVLAAFEFKSATIGNAVPNTGLPCSLAPGGDAAAVSRGLLGPAGKYSVGSWVCGDTSESGLLARAGEEVAASCLSIASSAMVGRLQSKTFSRCVYASAQTASRRGQQRLYRIDMHRGWKG